MNKLTRLAAISVLTLGAMATQSHAQNGFLFNQGRNRGTHQHLGWNNTQALRFQNPRAAGVGGILAGIGNGLGADPRNNVASGILQGIGGGLMMASQPTYHNQGYIQYTGTRYQNRYGHYQTYQRPQPVYYYHGH